MTSPENSSPMPFQKPIEIQIADALFIRMNMRKKHLQLTDLSEKYAHYSLWLYGSTIDFHKTLEPHNSHPTEHITLFKGEFDLQLVMKRMVHEVMVSRNSLYQVTKVNDSKWRNLEVEFIPTSTLTELLPTVVKGHRWNFGKDLLDNFDKLLHYGRLKELADCPIILGKSSEGFVVSNGTDCMICDGDLFSKIIEKSLGLSLDDSDISNYQNTRSND